MTDRLQDLIARMRAKLGRAPIPRAGVTPSLMIELHDLEALVGLAELGLAWGSRSSEARAALESATPTPQPRLEGMTAERFLAWCDEHGLDIGHRDATALAREWVQLWPEVERAFGGKAGR